MPSGRAITLFAALLLTLLLPASPAQALGVGMPQVSSGLNQPLQARVPLIDSGALSADQIQASLADERLWQALGLSRSAATDTLRLDVQGSPGALYLRMRGTRPFAGAMLQTLITLRWPQGAITPRITLLPSLGAGGGDDTTQQMAPADSLAALANPRNARQPPAPREVSRERSSGAANPSAESGSAANGVAAAELAALRSRVDELEERLQAQQMAQTSLSSTLSAGGSTAELIDTLDERQQQLAARLDSLDEQRLASLTDAPSPAGEAPPATPNSADSISNAASAGSASAATPDADAAQQASSSPSGETSQPAAPASASTAAAGGFPWLWLAAGLALLAVLLIALRAWRERRYRPVTADEIGLAASTEKEGDESDQTSAPEQENAEADRRSASRGGADSATPSPEETQAQAIRDEAAIFEQYGRLAQARELLESGQQNYPDSEILKQALAALALREQEQQAQAQAGQSAAPQESAARAQRDANEAEPRAPSTPEHVASGESEDDTEEPQERGDRVDTSSSAFSLLTPQELELQESERQQQRRPSVDIDTSGLQLSAPGLPEEPGTGDRARGSKVAFSPEDTDNERPESARHGQRHKR
ncbi:type IV pilus assembly protein FimV [Kushneria aurantia]|uniref:FimV N-terminal domain-containing protein n=1 Tax=Kushneria aurantia TaxID=504092 RepID=A0ABV6G6D1_9GAMM|nr:hypothetical protein [Kushneria aurantia]